MASIDSNKQHGAQGNYHSCLFCGVAYWCQMMHESPHSSVRQGARCCSDCRTRNLLSLASHEKRRREALYA